MPFMGSLMEQRLEFVHQYERRSRPVKDLCAAFKISRKTAYKWIARAKLGPEALADRSRARKTMAHRTPPEVVAKIVSLKLQYPTWGPKKIAARLKALHPELTGPAASTVGGMLAERDLVKKRSGRRGGTSPAPAQIREVRGPNSTWCLDYKGQFRLKDSIYCYPLTLSDSFSKMLLRCDAYQGVVRRDALNSLELAFEEFGLPTTIRSDNGVPFSNPMAHMRLSRLAVRLIELGIDPEYIDPGKPQQNGGHERMHRVLKHETVEPRAADLVAQQVRFDKFMRIFNFERPHEALGFRTPREVYEPSPRALPSSTPEPDYFADLPVRRTKADGKVLWRGRYYLTSASLSKKVLGIEPLCEGLVAVHFFSKIVGAIDEVEEVFIPNPDWALPAVAD